MCSNRMLDIEGSVWAVMVGNPLQGFHLVGPFKWTEAHAYIFRDDEPMEAWTLRLNTPAEMATLLEGARV